MLAKLRDSDLLARLVAFDSTSRKSNLPIADFVCDYLDDSAIEIVRNTSEDGRKVNLAIRICGTHPRPSGAGEPGCNSGGIVLCGHLDVVPADEPDWRSDPFTLTKTDDAYVGRGACDMKGFVALAINLARRAVGWELTHPLVLLFTFDEEVGLLGASHFVNSWSRPFALPRGVLVGEPTSMRLVRMHKGYVQMRITLKGRSAHSGYPALGVNAIEPAARAVSALSDLRAALQTEHHESSRYFPEAPYAALNVAQICGGSAVNVIPEHCSIDLTVRILPGADSGPVVARVRQAVENLDDRVACVVEVDHDNPPLFLPEESATNQRLAELLGQRDTVGVSYSSDAGVLQKMGLECALWGPGNIEVAHKPNESMPKEEFAQAAMVLERIVREFCK